MKRNLLLFMTMVMGMMWAGLYAQTGTATDPFLINNADQLVSLAQCVNAGGPFYYNPFDRTYLSENGSGRVAIPAMGEGTHFKLAADIVLNAGDVAACDGVKDPSWNAWSPIGTADHRFDGVFDGDFHLVSGMYLSQTTSGTGFFGATANHAEIKNLGVVNSYVAGVNSVGGLVGDALSGTIEKCFFTGVVTSTGTYTGGLVGQMQSGTVIRTCYTNAMVSSTSSQVGGLVGRIDSPSPACEILNSYSSSIVRGEYQFTGGLLGESKNSSSLFTGSAYDQQMIDLKNLTPYDSGTAMYTDAMTGNWAPTGFTSGENGFYPYITGFDIDSAGVFFSVVPILIPNQASLADLSAVDSITLGGESGGVAWTEVERVGIGSTSGYTMQVVGQCYAVLRAVKGSESRVYVLQLDKEPMLGTEPNPFTIDNLADLTAVRDGINSGVRFRYKHFSIPALGENTFFLQTADITMPTSNWNGLGYNSARPFKGVYDGGEHKLVGWTANTSSNAFFRYTENATIRNLTLDGVKSGVPAVLIYTMTGGTVDNCHATGSSAVKGGLIYETSQNSVGQVVIRNSSNANNISTTGEMGGIVRQVGAADNLIENCHNYGTISSTLHVGGIVGRRTESTTGTLTVRYCSNQDTIRNNSTDNNSNTAGVVCYGGSTVQYCYNTGVVMGLANTVAGISASGSVSYCYNLGVVSGGQGTNNARNVTVHGISSTKPSKCFNAGQVTNYSTGNAYGISSAGSEDCFNAGDVRANAGNVYSANSGTRTYSLGRLSGSVASIGGTYYDPARVPSFSTAGSSAPKTTAEMTSGSLMGNANWVETSGLYPRIKGLDTVPAAIAVALPITFSNSSDNVDHVTGDFTIANANGVSWVLADTSGAAIAPDGTDKQRVTLPADKTRGNIVLKAYKGSEDLHYSITLVMAVPIPGELTVDNVIDLQKLRDGINSGSAFNYKGFAVPAGGEGVTFKLTADFSFPGDGESWVPIGTEVYPFKGTFDGNGKTLSSLRQYSQNITGMFGYVEGTVKNLTLDAVNISNATYAGSICSSLRGGTLSNCAAKGTMTGGSSQYHTHKYMGGLVALASQGAKIEKCVNYVNVNSSVGVYASAAGIVADCSSDSKVDTCINAGAVTGAEFTAGICANGGSITACINYGDITGVPLSLSVAGISTQARTCGYITAVGNTVIGCVNSGKITIPVVSATCYVAGVSCSGTTSYSYNAGLVTGSNGSPVAGVNCGGTTSYCFNVGQVSGTGSSVHAVSNNVSTGSSYDTQMCTITDASATGKSTTEMTGDGLKAQLRETYFVYEAGMYPRVKGIENIPASLAIASPAFLQNTETVKLVNTDFSMGGCADHSVAWSIDAGTSLQIYNSTCAAIINTPGVPNLQAAVNDTIYKVIPLQVGMDAFIIKNAEQLNNFRVRIDSNQVFYYNPVDSTYHAFDDGYVKVPALGEDALFRVSHDIDLDGQLWTPISNSGQGFRGTLDGDNHTIRNFKLQNRGGGYIGLFGDLRNAYIKNLVIENVTTEDTITNVKAGTLSGHAHSSTIENVTVRNAIITSKANDAGGLIGNAESVHMRDCSLESSTINGATNVGGLVGNWQGTSLNNSSVKKSNITATGDYVGGVAGFITQQGVSFPLNYVRVDSCNISGANRVGGIAGQHTWSHGGTHTYTEVYGGTVKGSGDYVGGLYGYAGGLSLRYGVNTADVEGRDYVGGIIGSKQGSNGVDNFRNVRNEGSVTGRDYVGGILGYEQTSQYPASIHYAVNAGKVTGRNYVGGIRGYAFHTSTLAAVQCVNLGEVEGTQYVGGIIGWNQGVTLSNVNAGKVHGSNYVGGVVGFQSNFPGYSRSTQDSYSSGQVWGEDNVGNVAGSYEAGTLTNCFYDSQMSPDYKGVGTTGDDASGIAEGKLTAEMLNTTLGMSGFTGDEGLYPRPTTLKESAGAYVAAAPIILPDYNSGTVMAYTIPGVVSYAIVPSTANGVTWKQTGGKFNDGTFTVRAAGKGMLTASIGGVSKTLDLVVGTSKEMPCIIKNGTQLTNFTNLVNSGTPFYYNSADSTFVASKPENELTGIPINAGGESAFFKIGDNCELDYTFGGWAGPVGTTAHPFLGDFNGNGKSVVGLPNATSDTCGFFGVNGGVIYDLNIENSKMTSDEYSVVGALCGYNTGSISNCHVVNGTVSGANNVGGVVGVNAGYIEASYNSANVSGNGTVGGVAATNTNTVRQCFNLGDVSALATTNTNLGGVVGLNSGVLTNAYNAGNIKATGSASQNVGGVVGWNTSNNFSNCYNASSVTAPTASSTGGVAGSSTNTTIASLAFDRQMCTQPNAFGGYAGNATVAYTDEMTGTALQSVLGTDNWTYENGLYPRLRVMENLEASVVSVAPVQLLHGEDVANVMHDFTASTANYVVWTSEYPALSISGSDVTLVSCGYSPMQAKVDGGKEVKRVNTMVNYTASIVVEDTVCGGNSYTWDVNNVTYFASNMVVVSREVGNCPVTYTLNLTIPEPLSIVTDYTDEKCFGAKDGTATVSVSGGFGPYTYEWRNAEGTIVSEQASASNLAPGEYTVKVTDKKPVPKNEGDENCFVEGTVTIGAAEELVAAIDTFAPGCYGAVDGMFQISVSGGMAPYTLSWTPNGGERYLLTAEDHYEVGDLANGNYTVSVTDANSCSKSMTLSLENDATAYVITPWSGSKKYDGQPVSAGQYGLTIGTTDYGNHTSGEKFIIPHTADTLIVTTRQTSLTNVGEYPNDVLTAVVKRGSEDVTCTYNLQLNAGHVSITPRQVTLTSKDSLQFKNLLSTTCLSRNEVVVSGDGFVTDDVVSYDFSGSEICTNVSSYDNMKENRFTVVWGDVNPDNYEVTYEYGMLTLVENGILVVKAASLDRTYDGTTDTYGQTAGHDYDIIAYYLRKVDGTEENPVYDTIFYTNTSGNTITAASGTTYTVQVVMNNGSTLTVRDAGTIQNVVTSVNVFAGSVDITESFTRVETQNADLIVRPIEITMTSYDGEWTYDAQPHSRPGVAVEGTFLSGDLQVAPAANRAETNAGTYANTITYTLATGVNPDNYQVTKNEGTLTIQKRTLTLTGVEEFRETDGEEHCITDFSYGNLVAGHTASGIMHSACGTEIGDYYGTFSGTLVVKDAENYDVTANYDTVQVPGHLGIQSQAGTLQITSASKEQVYDGTNVTAHTYEVRYKGARVNPAADGVSFTLSTGDVVTVIPTNTAVSGIADVGEYKNDFTYSITHPENYAGLTLKFDTGLVKVTPRPVTLASMSLSRAYNGEDIRWDSVQVAGSQFVGDQGATYAFTSFTSGSRTNVGVYTNGFTYSLKSNTNASNYTITKTEGTLEVTKAVRTVTANDVTRPYGDPNGFAYTIDGFSAEEIESLVSGLETMTYVCDANQFSDIGVYTVTPNVSGLSAGNYTFEAVPGQLTVQRRPLTVNVVDVTVVYDGTLHNQTTNPVPSSSITLTNLATGDEADVKLVYSRTAGGESPISDNGTKISRDGGRDVTGNYTITVNGSLKITKKPLKIIVEDAVKPYDGSPLVATQYTVDPTDTLAEGDVISNVIFTGSQTEVGQSFSGISTADMVVTNQTLGQNVLSSSYELTLVSGKLTVTGGVEITSATNEWTYDGEWHEDKTYTVKYNNVVVPSDDATGLVFTLPVTGDKLTITPSDEAKVKDYTGTPVANAFTYTLENAGNYATPVKTNGTLTITKAAITIKADDKTKVYDNDAATDPALTATVTGVPTNGVAPVYSLSRAAGQNVGEYAITVTAEAASNPNYTVTVQPGTFSITTRDVTLTSASDSREYNGNWLTNNTVTVSGSGFVTGEGASYDVTGKQLVVGSSENTFSYTLNSNTLAANYDITTVFGTLTVTDRTTPYAITLTSSSDTVTYNGYEHSVSGFIADSYTTEDEHSYTVNGVTATASGIFAGTYPNAIVGTPVVWDEYGNDVTDQFDVTLAAGNLAIGKRPISFTIASEDATKMYDGTPLTVTYEQLNVQTLAETDTLVGGTITTNDFTVGEYPISEGNMFRMMAEKASTKSGFSIKHSSGELAKTLASYAPSFTLTLSITSRPLDLKADDATKVYDGSPLTNNSFTVTSTLGTGDAVSATVNGSQTCVDENDNEIDAATVQVMHDNGDGSYTDVTSNYDPVTLTKGTLKVTPITTGFDCPATLPITLDEGTADITLTESQLGTPQLGGAALPSYVTAASNIASLNPLTVGTYTVTWTLYDACNTAMTTCDQVVTVNYQPCEGIISMAGGTYHYKRVGTQCWFTENLREQVGDHHAYNDDASLVNDYGYLYTWYTAVGVAEGDDAAAPAVASTLASDGTTYVQGICPDGWSVGSESDYNILNSNVPVNMLKDPSAQYWQSGFEGTAGGSGFNARGAGWYNSALDRYEDFKTGYHFWKTDDTSGSDVASSGAITYWCDSILPDTGNKHDRKSVRCVRKVNP